MPGTIPGSQVLEFYNDAKILVTGATGFLGKALVEKFLRVCTNVDHIYLLIRVKKGKDPQSRLKDLIDDPVFSRLRKERPDFEKKLTCIPGDLTTPGLGMTDNDYEFLTQELTHVIHSAATVRFNEKLMSAIGINVHGTSEIVKLCRDCIKLKILVHVSTAYAYCNEKIIAEEHYEPPMPEESALTLVKILNEDKLNSICSDLIFPWPNTYSFTKAIAESIAKENGKRLPVVIFRPGIVMGAMNEPEDGWVDNYYGPTGVIAAVGAGVMRVILADEKLVANLVPVDLTVNALLCCAWEAGTSWNNNKPIENSLPNSKEPSDYNNKTEICPKIYNFTVYEGNTITWNDFRAINLYHGHKSPLAQSLWYYTLTLTRHKYVYDFLTILYHYLPGFFLDGVLFALGKKPQVLKASRKLTEFTKIMSFFSTTKLEFSNSNVQKLWSRMSEADKMLFPFNMSTVNWDTYLGKVVRGVRIFIFKENDDALPFARRKMFFLWIGHRLIQILFIVFCFWILSKFFFISQSVLQRPIDDSIIMKPALIRNSS